MEGGGWKWEFERGRQVLYLSVVWGGVREGLVGGSSLRGGLRKGGGRGKVVEGG